MATLDASQISTLKVVCFHGRFWKGIRAGRGPYTDPYAGLAGGRTTEMWGGRQEIPQGA